MARQLFLGKTVSRTSPSSEQRLADNVRPVIEQLELRVRPFEIDGTAIDGDDRAKGDAGTDVARSVDSLDKLLGVETIV